MKGLVTVLSLFIAMVSIQSCQSNKRANNYNNKVLVDDNGLLFFKNGTEASLATVKASGLAISNSKNQRIIQFAKAMIDDHTLLADNLKKLEVDNFVTASDSVTVVHEQMIASLEQKKAAEFDKAYIDMLIAQHEQEMLIFKAAVSDKNPNVSEFALKTIPSLQAHLDSAKMISSSLK